MQWKQVQKYFGDMQKTFNKPLFFVANQLDHEKSNFEETIKEAKEYFGNKVMIVQYPYNPGKDFNSIIDLIKMKLLKFSENGGTPEILDIPEQEKEKSEKLRNELIEAAAENDEALMETYFDKGNLSESEIIKGIKLGLINRNLFPVLCASAKKNMGIQGILDFIINVCPAPNEVSIIKTTDGKIIECNSSKPLTIFVFKTTYEEHLGEMTFFKVCSGELSEAMELENANTFSKRKIHTVICGFREKKGENRKIYGRRYWCNY